MELHAQIKKYRANMKLSQEELADRVFVTRQTISNWENGKSYPDINSLLLLSQVFDISLDQLIKGDIDAMREESRLSGVAEENARIKSLDAIAKTVAPEALNEAKYGENKTDGKTLAYDAMVNGEKLARAYLQDAQEDSDISGANDVGAGKPDEEEQNEADEMAAYINKKKGV